MWVPGASLERRVFSADEIDIFRFSAVTWNAHRIHFDERQARKEGLRGVAVQAHLQGAWLAQAARSVAGPAARLSALSWSNRAPVIARDEVTVTGTVDDVVSTSTGTAVTLTLTESGPDGTLCAEGRATVEVPT
jgi:hydroxyacyl-ACP dehydratase HTD2-like protein with hotdog domain